MMDVYTYPMYDYENDYGYSPNFTAFPTQANGQL